MEDRNCQRRKHNQYYHFAGQKVAMRQCVAFRSCDAPMYLHGDHLGSVSLTTNNLGAVVSESRYLPFGEQRWASGVSETDFSFTGQREERGFGLSDYNARFYSSRLGRFVSADSIIPRTGNVAVFDRYSYVLNNPLKYIDPSGHDVVCILLLDDQCVRWRDNIPRNERPHPTTINPLELSDVKGGTTGVSGKDLYAWYLELYRNKAGWWWEMFGQGGFTIWDAFAVLAVVEASRNWSDPSFSEAAIRAANKWCIDQEGGPCTTEGYINWFAWYSQSAGIYVSTSTTPHDPRNGYIAIFGSDDEIALNDWSESFENHDSSWNEGCADNRPCGWGNNSDGMYPEDVRKHLQANQTALFTYNPPDGIQYNPWFIPSGCVSTNWLDSDHRDLTILCPDVASK